MTRNSGPEGTQRSVAELLAAYGGSQPGGGGGRRRRRDDDAPDTENDAAPQDIINRIRTGAAPQAEAAHRHGGDQWDGVDDAVPSSNGTAATEPPAAARPAEAVTEQLRVTDQPPAGGPDTAAQSDQDTATLPPPLPRREVSGAPAAGEPPAGLDPAGWDEQGQTEEVALPADHDVQPHREVAVPPADPHLEDGFYADERYPDHEDEEPERERSSAKEWLVMASQLSAGVIGGAALWLTFQWLWRSIPVLALIVALVVITGLVWVVRVLRRAEDLQTTVVAVLVGLFVTVSPAALLLVAQ